MNDKIIGASIDYALNPTLIFESGKILMQSIAKIIYPEYWNGAKFDYPINPVTKEQLPIITQVRK
ncbi:MAG: hypothetical protein M1419_04735 [Bacteroidetes bacterium]|nr:hypothetical protein [Bacteroidota bacterium]